MGSDLFSKVIISLLALFAVALIACEELTDDQQDILNGCQEVEYRTKSLDTVLSCRILVCWHREVSTLFCEPVQ